MRLKPLILFWLALLIALPSAAAARELRDGGKLLLTGGVTSVEGSAGGGLATWGVIAGDETDAGIGGTIHATYIPLPDFDMKSAGIAIGLFDRVELSYAYQSFDTRKAGATLGLGQGFKFGQHVLGAKLRVIGDAVYGQQTILPQISIGIQHKRADQDAIIKAVGGRQSSGTDFYIAATKAVLSRSIVVNATARFTKANQFGLLGFGGDRSNGYSAQLEASAGLLVSRRLLLGAEFRTKPSNLSFAKEDHVYDVFAAWAVGRRLSLTAAYTDLGSIATVPRQRGAFLSLQGSF